MILTSQRDDEVLVIWTTFDFLRANLMDCINILQLKNNETRRRECTGGGFKGMGMGLGGGGGGGGGICFSLENISSFVMHLQ